MNDSDNPEQGLDGVLSRARSVEQAPGSREPGSAPPQGRTALRLPSGLRGEGPAGGLDPVLGRIGSLEVRLADHRARDPPRRSACASRSSTRRCRRSRRRAPSLSRRDVDGYDAICDHLLVLDHDAPRRPFRTAKPKVVGTYRLLRQEVADRHGGFYTRGRIRHRAAARGRIRNCASWSSAAPACSSPTATSARSSCSGTGSGPTCCITAST